MTPIRLAGWQFWILDSGRLRTFIVAIDDFADAQAKAVAQTKGGKAVSYRRTPVSLIPYLQLPREEVVELVSVDPAREPVAGGILVNDEIQSLSNNQNYEIRGIARTIGRDRRF